MMHTLVVAQTQEAHQDSTKVGVQGARSSQGCTRGIRLDFSHFGGDNLVGWVFNTNNQYFYFQQTSPIHRNS